MNSPIAIQYVMLLIIICGAKNENTTILTIIPSPPTRNPAVFSFKKLNRKFAILGFFLLYFYLFFTESVQFFPQLHQKLKCSKLTIVRYEYILLYLMYKLYNLLKCEAIQSKIFNRLNA